MSIKGASSYGFQIKKPSYDHMTWILPIGLSRWWLVIDFPIQLGMSSSKLTFIFFRGVGIPPTRKPMVNVGIAIENHHFEEENRLEMGYVQ